MSESSWEFADETVVGRYMVERGDWFEQNYLLGLWILD